MLEKPFKLLLDKISLALYFTLLLINVLKYSIEDIFGGWGYYFLLFLLLGYFYFYYGKRGVRKLNCWSFIIFSIAFCLFTQFVLKTGEEHSVVIFTFKTKVWNFFSFVPTLAIAVVIFERSTNEHLVGIRKILVVVLVVLSIVSISIARIDSEAVKMTATGERSPNFLIEFATVYGLAICFPCLMAWLLKSKHKITISIILLLILVCLFLASYFLSLLCVIVGGITFLFFCIKNKWVRNSLIILFIIFLGIMLGSGAISRILLALSEKTEIYNIQKRLEEIAEFLKTGRVKNTTIRIEMYINGFLGWTKHPILGNVIFNPYIVLSGHSEILDILNGYGLILFVPFVWFLVEIYRKNKYRSLIKRAAIVAMFVSLIFYLLSNPLFASPVIMVFYILFPIVFMGEPDGVKNAHR